tara:strand:+ start:288 stop:671 length:384 start_codon:yes stop_codon:yes gene_type:complete
MAHYAFLDENNKVVEVITGKGEDDTDTLPEEFDSWEDWYADFKGLTCKRTSYNTRANTHTNGGTPFRGNYAGLGYTYDEDNDVFIPPKPYPSWTLNSNWEWEAPVDYPDSVNLHYWNENLGEWEEIT